MRVSPIGIYFTTCLVEFGGEVTKQFMIFSSATLLSVKSCVSGRPLLASQTSWVKSRQAWCMMTTFHTMDVDAPNAIDLPSRVEL